MKNRLTGVLALAVLLILGMIVPATAGTDHCPGANPSAPSLPDGYSVLLDNDATENDSQEDRNDTVLSAGTQVCAKGGTGGATGIVTADGEKTLQGILGTGQDVSYYMTYARAQVEPEPLKPILECVSEDWAYFGYLNENEATVDVPIGDGNKVTGAGDIDYGQPTAFLPGRTDYVDEGGAFVPCNAAFAVPYSGSDIVWTLTGPDGATRTATAGANSPACPEPPAEPLTGVRGTFMCKAPSDGSFELYVDGETGFVSRELHEGEYVFRYTNPNDEEVRFSAGTPAGNDNVVPEWMSIGAGQTVFESFDSPIAGVSTNTVPLGESVEPINRGTFSTNETQICEATPVDDTAPITVQKEWTGDTGDPAFDAEDLTITFTIDGETYEPGDTLDAVVTIDGDDVILPPPPTSFEESVDGLADVCAWALVDHDLIYSETDEAWVLLVTNLVACGEDTTTIITVPGEDTETIIEVEVPVEVEVLPEVIEAEPEPEPEPEPEVVEEDEPEPVVEETEVLGVTATRAVPTGIDSGTGGYLPGSTPTAALLLMLFGGLALTGGAAASLVRRDG